MSCEEAVSVPCFQLLKYSLTCLSALIAGGGAPEIHVSRLLTDYAHTLKGKEAYCFQAFAEALEIIPTTLAENAGLNPISIVTELRNKHALGDRNAGINVKKGIISNILEENVVQPLLVSTSALELATETVALILKIDDIQVRILLLGNLLLLTWNSFHDNCFI